MALQIKLFSNSVMKAHKFELRESKEPTVWTRSTLSHWLGELKSLDEVNFLVRGPYDRRAWKADFTDSSVMSSSGYLTTTAAAVAGDSTEILPGAQQQQRHPGHASTESGSKTANGWFGQGEHAANCDNDAVAAGHKRGRMDVVTPSLAPYYEWSPAASAFSMLPSAPLSQPAATRQHQVQTHPQQPTQQQQPPTKQPQPQHHHQKPSLHRQPEEQQRQQQLPAETPSFTFTNEGLDLALQQVLNAQQVQLPRQPLPPQPSAQQEQQQQRRSESMLQTPPPPSVQNLQEAVQFATLGSNGHFSEFFQSLPGQGCARPDGQEEPTGENRQA